jgi:RNA polymerase sigma-70 factor (ECF subfamily)
VAGRAAHPALEAVLSEAEFHAWGEARGFSADTHAGDLYLACACARGAPAALAGFDEAHLRQVGSFVARVDPSPAFADEVRQAVRVLLFSGERGGKIAEYAGRGPLSAWVRVVAVRLAMRQRQASEPKTALTSALPESGDPEIALIRARHGAVVMQALGDSLRALTPEERAALKLYYLDGLTLEQIGALYGVHASTVWRRIAAIQETLTEGLHARAARAGIPAHEIDSLIGLIRSRIDLSLSTLLRTTAA